MYINSEIEAKIDELLKKMTLHEKAGQLHQIGPSPVGGFEISEADAAKMLEEGKITEQTFEAIKNHTMLDRREDDIRRGSIGSFIGVDNAQKSNKLQRIAVEESRLGIPMIMGMDVIHGHKTIFPVPLAQSCTFDEKTFEKSTGIAAKEAREDGIHWTYAPMVDIARDTRWGRVAEGVGEDTYLASRYAAAMVRGFQGEKLGSPNHLAACVKHFAAYGACEGGRDYDTVDMSLPKFYEIYLPPFAAAINEGAATVMVAFNDLNGIPCTTNEWLLKDVLRGELGFEGFVISDANAINECVIHGTSYDIHQAVKQSIEAGCDMDLGSDAYINHLEEMIKNGEISEDTLDDSVRAVLRIKFALGLFENPYTEIPQNPSKLCEEHRAAALDIARKSAVLLKNNNAVLPINKNARIAVVGAVADNRDEMHGTWVCSGESGTAVSLIDALKKRNVDFKFSPCVDEDMPFNRDELLETIQGADVVIAALSYCSAGEANSRCELELSKSQLEMLDSLKETGKPVIGVLFNGRTLALGSTVSRVTALLEAWHLGTETGNAVADILFGDYNPSGRLTATVPHSSAQLPVYYNHPRTGRPAGEAIWTNKYLDMPLQPLFPFGYGLSYTRFDYSNLSIETAGDMLTATVTVINTGKYAGEETVQLYIHRKNATRVRPVRELKGFCKLYLEPGEAKCASISVAREEMGYYDVNMNYITDKSEFDIYMAPDSSSGLCETIVF